MAGLHNACMSFITRCPACGTAFKVVSDQLKISEGWVRCGHCAEIFDATLDLQPWWPGVEAVAATGEAVDKSPEAPNSAGSGDGSSDGVFTQQGVDAEVVEVAELGGLAEPGVLDVDKDANPADAEQVQPAEPELAAHGRAELNDYLETPAPSVSVHAEWGEIAPLTEESALGTDVEDADAVAELSPKPSFVREAERRAFWRRPAVQAVGGVAALLFGFALVFQAGLHWREPLSVRFPATAPWLQQACRLTGCYAGPPRAIDLVSIDSSAMLRRSVGRYAFDMVVKNAARVELATPALELTLTDANDRVLVRRVLLASDWPEPRETLAPGRDWAVRLDLSLDGPEAAVMTGYRAVLFYP